MTVSDEVRELLPCPFCGGENIATFGPCGWYRQWGISHSCPTFYSGSSELAKGFNTEAGAIAAWNTRALSQRPSPHDEGVELARRLRCHAVGLRENERYDGAKPSGLTNADAVSYAGLLGEAADAIEKARAPKLDEGVTSDCELCVGKCRGHRLGHPEDWEPEPGSRAARSPVIAEVKELLREENELAFSTRPLEEIARRRFDIMQAKAAILPRLLTLIEGGGK